MKDIWEMSSRDISPLFFQTGEKEETTNIFVLFQEKAKQYLTPPLCNMKSARKTPNCSQSSLKKIKYNTKKMKKLKNDSRGDCWRVAAESRRGEMIRQMYKLESQGCFHWGHMDESDAMCSAALNGTVSPGHRSKTPYHGEEQIWKHEGSQERSKAECWGLAVFIWGKKAITLKCA